MRNIVQILYAPGAAWQEIAQRAPGVWSLLVATFAPLVLVGVGAEYLGLTRWGNPVGDLGLTALVPEALALRYTIAQVGLALVSLLAGAKLLVWVCEGFHFRTTFGQCFTLACYGLAPFYVARMLDAFPLIHTWVCWGIGAGGCVSVLYQGTGIVLQPDQTKGFGLYLLSAFVLVFLAGLSHFVALAVLDGRLLR